jgi:hypothetical protein
VLQYITAIIKLNIVFFSLSDGFLFVYPTTTCSIQLAVSLLSIRNLSENTFHGQAYVHVKYINIKKVKQTHYRPGVTPRVPGS